MHYVVSEDNISKFELGILSICHILQNSLSPVYDVVSLTLIVRYRKLFGPVEINKMRGALYFIVTSNQQSQILLLAVMLITTRNSTLWFLFIIFAVNILLLF